MANKGLDTKFGYTSSETKKVVKCQTVDLTNLELYFFLQLYDLFISLKEILMSSWATVFLIKTTKTERERRKRRYQTQLTKRKTILNYHFMKS